MRTSKRPTKIIMSVVVITLTSGISATYAFQPDGPATQALEVHGDIWKKEDKAIDEKLAALERRFGKKPNIIYILADDIGWGELGSYGGGKLRGTPGKNTRGHLRKGAHEECYRPTVWKGRG